MKQKGIKKKKINIIPALVIILLIIMVSGSIFLYIRNQELQKKSIINSSGVEKVYKDKKFVFDDLEIIVSSKYNFLNTEKMQKQYEGKDIIEIPVQVKNVESTENNFSISFSVTSFKCDKFTSCEGSEKLISLFSVLKFSFSSFGRYPNQ